MILPRPLPLPSGRETWSRHDLIWWFPVGDLDDDPEGALAEPRPNLALTIFK